MTKNKRKTCKRCGISFLIKPHTSKGFCKICYQWHLRRANPEFREKQNACVRKYLRKKAKENPEWNRKRQRDFRKNHPDTFNYMMARYYMKKLKNKKRLQLIKEIKIKYCENLKEKR